MFHKVFTGLKAFLILWIGVFTLQIVKIPILSWVKGPQSVQAGELSSYVFSLDPQLRVKNPFLPASQALTSLASNSLPKQWILKGTLLLGKKSKVILEDLQTGEQQMLSEGELFKGTRIVKIGRNEVELEQSIGHFTLALDQTLRQKQKPVQVALVATKEQKENIKHHLKIKKKTLEKLVQKIPDLVRSAELILFEGYPPVPSGYLIAVGPQLMHMDPMGLEDGDVIKKVDGIPLDSEKTLLEVFHRIGSQKKIEVELDRDLKDMVITYYVES